MRAIFLLPLLAALLLSCPGPARADLGDAGGSSEQAADPAAENAAESGRPDPAAESASGTDVKKAGVFARFGKRVEQIWKADGLDIIIPAYTWHNRLAYDASLAESFNEHPWGFGLGRSIRDEDGDQHLLYMMGFMDSNRFFQYYGGYAFLKMAYLNTEKDIGVGAGFTLGTTGRYEFGYVPLPLPLPVVSLQFKSLAVEAAYVPGIRNYGHVLFTWLRLHF